MSSTNTTWRKSPRKQGGCTRPHRYFNAIDARRATYPVPKWMLARCGFWLIGLGLYFFLVRSALLPEDSRFMGAPLEQIHAAVPRLDVWLTKVFAAMGGFMAGAGVLTVFVSSAALPSRPNAGAWAIAISGVLTARLMSASNFALQSDFKWMPPVPALVWLAGLGAYVARL